MTRRRLSEKQRIALSIYWGPKYCGATKGAYAAVEAVPERRELSCGDAKKLATLVRKYGRNVVAEAAGTIHSRGPGRRADRRSPLNKYHVAWLIDTWAKQARQAGSGTPIKDAVHLFYEVFVSEEEQRQAGHFQRWQKSIKKKRLQGRPSVQVKRQTADAKEN
jgi:hypothetical protein